MSLVLAVTMVDPSFGPQPENDLRLPFGRMIIRIIIEIKSIVFIFGNRNRHINGMMLVVAIKWVSFVRTIIIWKRAMLN